MALTISDTGRRSLNVRNSQMSGLTGRDITKPLDLGYPRALQRKTAMQSLISAPADSISQASTLAPATTTPATQTSTTQATTPTTAALTNRFGALGGSGSGIGPSASDTNAGAMGNRVGVNVGTSQAAPGVSGVQRASLDFDNPTVAAAARGAANNFTDLAMQGRKLGASWPAIMQASPVPVALGAAVGMGFNAVDSALGVPFGRARDLSAREALSGAEGALGSDLSMGAARRAVDARTALTRAQFEGDFNKPFTNQVVGLGIDAIQDAFGLTTPSPTENQAAQVLGLANLEAERTASNQQSATAGLSRDPYGDEHLGTAYSGMDAADVGSAIAAANTSPASEISSDEMAQARAQAIAELSAMQDPGVIGLGEENPSYGSEYGGRSGITAQDLAIDKALGLSGVSSLSPAVRASFYGKYGATTGGSGGGGYGSNSRGGRDGTAR